MSLTESLLTNQPQKFQLWPSVWKLLRLRARILWNGFVRSKLRSKIGYGFLALLLLGAMAFLYFASAFLLRFIQSPQLAQYINPAQFIDAIPTMVLTGAFVLTLMTNFGVLLQALYLSRDMDFLITTPMPMRAVFLAKLLEAILPNFGLFCAFSLPVLFGLGSSAGYTFLYYPLLVVMLALLALAAGGTAAILVMAVVRVVPARRVAEVLGVVGATASILCGQSANLMQAFGVNRGDVGSALSTFSRLNTPYSPLAWAGRGLLSVGRAEWLPGLALSLATLLLAGGLFAGALYLAEQLYYSGWASMQGSIRRKRPARAAGVLAGAPPKNPDALLQAAGAASRGTRLIPAQLRGLVFKDLLLIRRDPRNFSQLITPLILGFVFLFTTQGGGRNTTAQLTQLGLGNLEVYGIMALAIFVGWMLMTNLSTLAFTREGRNYWLLKSSPIRPLYLLMGKFIASYLPAGGISLIYLILAFIIRRQAWTLFPFAALVILFSLAGATGVGLSFGVGGANLEWDKGNRQRLRGTVGCLAYIALSAFLLVNVTLFLLPIGLLQVFSGAIPLWGYALGLLLGITCALAGMVLPPMLTIPRLARIGEPEP